MNIIVLTPWDLAIAGLLVVVLATLSHFQKLSLGKRMLVGATRTAVQLTLIGFVLKALFAQSHWGWVGLMGTVMLLVAGREAVMRQPRRFKGWWAFGIGTSSMFLSSFVVTILVLNLVISPAPWYTPQYAIPLLGMMLGNTLNSVALTLDRLTQETWRAKGSIEARLLLGHSWREAIGPIRKEAMRTGMIPMLNAMAAAGVVSLPGMMTGQILAGNPPMVAVSYQILIMFMIAAGAGFGAIAAVSLGARRLFDERQRLRLDRLRVLEADGV